MVQIAPTKSNLLNIQNQLAIAEDGYDLLEQKRELLVMELMKMVEKVRLLENEMESHIEQAYESLRHMFIAVGHDQTERIARSIEYEYQMQEVPVFIGGIRFSSLTVDLPKKKLSYSYLHTFADCDKLIADFSQLLRLLTEMASIRTIVWRLAREVKKTQRRVNALDKHIIPEAQTTVRYIQGVLEERDRENVFVLKTLKAKKRKAHDSTAF